MSPLDEPSAESLSWLWDSGSASFIEWSRATRGVFWITGCPGSGKSMAMSRILQAGSRLFGTDGSCNKPGPDGIIVSFFCKAQARPLERSCEGMLRSLLWQIFERRPDLVGPCFDNVQLLDEFRSRHLPWSRTGLENALLRALAGLDPTPVVLLVDGLDELAEADTDVAKLVRSFIDRAPRNARICIASRPYIDFAIAFRSCSQLVVEEQSNADIAFYVRDRLKDEDNVLLNPRWEDLADQVIRRACGVFLWVKLVVDSLLRGWHRYETIDQLSARLQETPQDLVDLYAHMLTELDCREQQEARRMLLLTSQAKRSLLLEEFCYAVQCTDGCSGRPNDTICLSKKASALGYLYDVGVEERRRMRQRLTAVSRGLISVKHTALGEETVTLLHETVHTFVQTSLQTEMVLPTPHIQSGEVLWLHACVHYMVALFNGCRDLLWTLDEASAYSEENSDYQMLGPASLNGRRVTEDTKLSLQPRLQFLSYTMTFWLEHALDLEAALETSDEPIIDAVSLRELLLWRFLTEDSKSTRVVQPLAIDKLTLLSEAGLHHYVEAHLQKTHLSHHEVRNAVYMNYVLFTVARHGCTTCAGLLFTHGASVSQQNGSVHLALPTTPRSRAPRGSRNPDKSVKEFMGSGAFGSQRHWTFAAFARAVHFDHLPLVELLLAHGVCLDDDPGPFTMQWLESGGRVVKVRVERRWNGDETAEDESENEEYLVQQPVVPISHRSRISVGRGGTIFNSSTPGASTRVYRGDYNAIEHAVMRRSRTVLPALLRQARVEHAQSRLNLTLAMIARLGADAHIFAEQLMGYGARASFNRSGADCRRLKRPCSALFGAVVRSLPLLANVLLQSGASLTSDFQCSPVHGSILNTAIDRFTVNAGNGDIQMVLGLILRHSTWLNGQQKHSLECMRTSVQSDLLREQFARLGVRDTTDRPPRYQGVRRKLSFESDGGEATEEGVGLVTR